MTKKWWKILKIEYQEKFFLIDIKKFICYTMEQLTKKSIEEEAIMGTIIGEGITFDDVLLVPAYSEVTPNMVDLTTRLTK